LNESFMKRITVMVIDNDGELSFEIEGMLSSRVKSIHYIKDPAEALRDFNSIMPQVVIVDLKLAMMDIVDFASKIKNMNAECELIVTLGFLEPHKLIEMVNLGIYRFVPKPLSVPKLADAVSKAMDSLLDRAVSFQSKYMQEILNAEDNPVFETDGVTVLKANKAFMECFGAKSIKQFSLAYPTLVSMFKLEEGVQTSPNWLKDYIQENEEPKAILYDNRLGEKREFFLDFGVSEATKNNFVVTMTDITGVEKTFNRRIEMLSSQINSKEKIKFRSMLEFEIARCKRYKKNFSLLLISFEIVENAAVEEWEKVFKVMRHTLRSSDLFAKVDTKQLAVIATETHKSDAKRILVRLDEEFKRQGFDIGFKGNAAEFSEEDTVQSIFKKAAIGI
jgi:DNA-binding NarL/FixJ family response regulator